MLKTKVHETRAKLLFPDHYPFHGRSIHEEAVLGSKVWFLVDNSSGKNTTLGPASHFSTSFSIESARQHCGRYESRVVGEGTIGATAYDDQTH